MNWRLLFNRFLPHRCIFCGVHTGDSRVCSPCLADLPRLPDARCPQCTLPSPSGQICGACLKQAPAYDRTLGVLTYDFPVDRLIQALKYRHRLDIAPALAEIWLGSTRPDHLPDFLVPMPLHPARQKERGFNQALELGRLISRQLAIPIRHDACMRIRDTAPQASLKLEERRRNLRGAFSVDPDKVSGKRIAIMDDVMTSGSSLNELATTLKKAGAIEVDCWVMARALPPKG